MPNFLYIKSFYLNEASTGQFYIVKQTTVVIEK